MSGLVSQAVVSEFISYWVLCKCPWTKEEPTIKPCMLLNRTAMQDFHSEGRFNYPISEMHTHIHTHTPTHTSIHTYTQSHLHPHTYIYAINVEIIFQIRGTNLAIAFWSNALLLFYKFYNISVLLYEILK